MPYGCIGITDQPRAAYPSALSTIAADRGPYFMAVLTQRFIVPADRDRWQRLKAVAARRDEQRKLAETNRRIAVSGSLARESERRRVAYGLHEDLGQRLSALKIALAAMVGPAAAPSLRAVADSMTAQLDEAVTVVRRMSGDLHPLILEKS